MANYDPFDPVAMKFTKLHPTLQCRNNEAWLTRVENGTIIVNETLLNVRNETLLECSYNAVIRVTDKLITYSEPEAFQTQIALFLFLFCLPLIVCLFVSFFFFF